ncbi:MAG: hypothetical protein ACI8S6_001914 [Myxococcota bacterium]|jgi:hypothetical protein
MATSSRRRNPQDETMTDLTRAMREHYTTFLGGMDLSPLAKRLLGVA